MFTQEQIFEAVWDMNSCCILHYTRYKLTSDTGIVPDDGIIATGTLTNGNALDVFVLGNDSKLATLKFYSRDFTNNNGVYEYNPDITRGGFDKCQTFFTVVGDSKVVIHGSSLNLFDHLVCIYVFFV